MALDFSINFQSLRALSGEVKKKSEDYSQEIKKIYDTIDKLSANWVGEDYKALANKVLEYKPTMETLGRIIDNYGVFLNSAADKIEGVQQNLKNSVPTD